MRDDVGPHTKVKTCEGGSPRGEKLRQSPVSEMNTQKRCCAGKRAGWVIDSIVNCEVGSWVPRIYRSGGSEWEVDGGRETGGEQRYVKTRPHQLPRGKTWLAAMGRKSQPTSGQHIPARCPEHSLEGVQQ